MAQKRPILIYKTEKVIKPDDIATGAAIRMARERAGLSLRDIGELIGVSAPYISDLERGRRSWNEDLFKRIVSAIAGDATK